MHLLVAPYDPPIGHQNISRDICKEIREQVDPEVWDTLVPGRAKCVPPGKIQLSPGEEYPWKRQYPLKPVALRGFQLLLSKFLNTDSLCPANPLVTSPSSPFRSLVESISSCKTNKQ